MPGCAKHTWDGKGDTVKCVLCQAVAHFDTGKDPFKEGEPTILKPPEEEWLNLSNKKRHQIFESCKNHIKIDASLIGKEKTCRKWSMASSTLHQLLESWEKEGRKSPPPGITDKKVELPPLPPLPPFDNEWAPDVQIKWLEVYALMQERRIPYYRERGQNTLPGNCRVKIPASGRKE